MRIKFSASWWSGNEKQFCFLFIESRTLLQRYAELIDFYKSIFLYVISVRILVPWFQGPQASILEDA